MGGTKVAVITGASRGIGRAIAESLAGDGVAVAVNYASSSVAAEQIVGAIRNAGGSAIAVRADVADADQVRALFDQVQSEFGGVDFVVTSAGTMRPALMVDTTDEDFSDHVQINIRGTFNALREAAKRVRDWGRIVTFSSTTLALNAPGYGLYNATKGAVEGFTRVLAKELGARGVTVNAVAPGPVETQLFLAGKTPLDLERLAGMVPQHRLGQPVDIADAVSLLISPAAGWISGQVVRVNGGLV